ncbi:MAG TPA: tetratricopeptide repeat protein [Rhizomicrobium sp.]|nr:tetratricopeptide repeat protein [Rhizomicrobium sp.]
MRALRERRPDEAERLAVQVLKSDRANIAAAEILARALLLQDRAAEAVDPLRRAAKRSDNPAIATLFAAALSASGERDEACAVLTAITERTPPFLPAFLDLAALLDKANCSDNAIAVLERGLAHAPNAIDLQMRLGTILLDRNDRVRARVLFENVRTAAPERHDAIVALARVATGDGDHAAAADLYRRALGLKPDDALARINLAKCLFELGDRDAGETALRAATRVAPHYTGLAVAALANAPKGRVFLKPSRAAKFVRDGE